MALAANALTTLAEALDVLGLVTDAGGPNDTLAEKLIKKASGIFEDMTDREFGRDAATVEQVAGFGTTALLVRRRPIRSLTSITFDGSTIDLTDVTTPGDGKSGRIERPGGWSWTTHVADDISQGPLAGTEREVFEVTYDGGFVLPKDDGVPARDLPEDIEEACLQIITALDQQKGRDRTIKSEKLMSWGASYDTSAAASRFGSFVESVVSRYRRRF